jgi:hypothetical protein
MSVARDLLRRAGRRHKAVVFVVALAVWWIQAIVIPLAGGRDLATYLGAYVQLGWSHPVDLGYVLGRTPLAALGIGGLLDVAGGALAEPVVSVLYAASVVAWFVAARRFSSKAAVLVVVVLLAYPGYGILFHELSSDSLFAAAFAGWTLLLVDTMLAPTWRRFALVGAGTGVLVLVRPANQVLLVLALLPLVLAIPWRARAASAAAFLAAAVAIVGGWALHNGLRYGDYVVVRGGNATLPFFRAFVTEKIVRPTNGPASRELAQAVQRRLLPHEPYRSYAITLDDFFREASPRMEVDLLWLSDRVKGWHTNGRWLRDVGVEAVRTHERTYARGVAGSTWGMLLNGLFRTPAAPASASPAVPSGAGGGDAAAGPTIVVHGRRLPQPSEGEPIPAPYQGGITSPDGSIYTVWTSPTEHHQVFVHPEDERRNVALHVRMEQLAQNLPDRRGSPSLAHRFNQLSRWFPPPILWLLLGLGALFYRRTRGSAALAAPSVAALLVIVVSALGLPAEPHYSVPVAPAFVLLAGGALFAPRRELSPSYVLRVVSFAAGLAAAAFAVVAYATPLDARRDGAGAPHDLDVFLRAAGSVLKGASPYVYDADRTFAYPPLLAWLLTPLHPLSSSTAAIVWMLLSLAMVGGALWLLELRDWRCYALAYVFMFTRSSINLGTIEPLLLLAVAVAWRYRDRMLPAAGAVAGSIVLKLFLWPLVVWLALTRRVRAAALSVALAVGMAAVSWAAIGFAGLGDYPHVLRRLADDESTSSYSVVALGVRAHLPLGAARVIAVLVALALLAAAAWVARDERRPQRERDAMTLTIALAAALAASPIVWVHYFLLLLVPLALTRPRLSPLWFVPLAYQPLGLSAWPAGDARKLGLALVATLVILGGALVTPDWHALRRRLGFGREPRPGPWAGTRVPGHTSPAERSRQA